MHDEAPAAAELEEPKDEKAKVARDPELDAMNKIARLLRDLSADERERVISWAHAKFCCGVGQ